MGDHIIRPVLRNSISIPHEHVDNKRNIPGQCSDVALLTGEDRKIAMKIIVIITIIIIK